MAIKICRPRRPSADQLARAAARAAEIDPSIRRSHTVEVGDNRRRGSGERRLAVVIDKKWPASGVHLSVSFLDNPSAALRKRILLHMNAWSKSANVRFSETRQVGQVRIARLEGDDYWSEVGTDILGVADDEATMNLDGFTMKISEAEFRRVVRHEAGHTLGFDHEHLRTAIVNRIIKKKAYAYFKKNDGWSRADVDDQVLIPLKDRSLMGTTEADELSIMCYDLPGEIMKDGKPVIGGSDINANDFAFAAKIYPKKKKAPGAAAGAPPLLSGAAPASDEDVDTFHIVILDQSGASGAAGSKSDVAMILASYGGARVTAPLRLRKANKRDQKTLWGDIIAMQERLRAYTNRERGELPRDQQMKEFGNQLFETLFSGSVRRLYDEARSRQRRRLDFVLTSMIPWISEKPWEFAFDAGRDTFLATEDTHFVRNVLTSVPADPIVRVDGPLRILVAAAQPVGFGRLSVDQEITVIRRGFQALVDQGLIEIEVMPRATPEAMHLALIPGRFHAAHFIGHGVYDEEKEQGCLIFENEYGRQYPLGERDVRAIFCKRGLSMVFLNSCESGRGGRAEFNKGVAQSLVAHGLPALVANQYSVLDSSATSFAQAFYRMLAGGFSVGQSAREARIAVNYSMHGEPIDWAVPVLYARDPGMTLCATPAGRPMPVAPAARASRPAARTTSKRTKIAVWDVDEVLPGLARTLDVMTGAQDVFAFELVRLSAPLDVWYVDPESKLSFLWAEKLANRLKDKATELGVDVLVCLTNHWMCDNQTLYLYGWWPAKQTPRVMTFSTAGFDEIPPEGPVTDRAIANGMVSGLAGFFGNADTHEDGEKDCPLAYNEERDLDYVTGPLEFDPVCKRKLVKPLGAKLPALEKLLKVFRDPDSAP
jgi:hypothetical protein